MRQQISRLLALCSSLLLAAAVGATLSRPAASDQGADESACTQWEVSTWNPGDTCTFSGGNPYVNRNDWCTVPAGAEPVAVVSAGGGAYTGAHRIMWAVRRCRSRHASVPEPKSDPATVPLNPSQRAEKVSALASVTAIIDGQASKGTGCVSLVNHLAGQAMELPTGRSVAALQAIEEVGDCSSEGAMDQLAELIVRFGLELP